MTTAWGSLSADQIGHSLTLTLPWADEPVTYVLLSVDQRGQLSYATGVEAGVPATTCTLDVPEWGGANPFILPNDVLVEVGA